MADHDHTGHVDDDGYCELHSFHEIGKVSSDVGCFAIIDIGSGPDLTDWFTKLVDASGIRRPNPLTTFGMSAAHDMFFDGWKGPEYGVVINAEQGSFPVYARFCDLWGDGRMSICELRIDLHHHYHDLDDVDTQDGA